MNLARCGTLLEVRYILLTAIIQKATGMTALAFANKVLFGPLGISGAVWETDPHGIENGGNRLYITARDMAKIGYLYLNNGEWNGKQIVPKDYVLSSTKHLYRSIRTQKWSFTGWGYRLRVVDRSGWQLFLRAWFWTVHLC